MAGEAKRPESGIDDAPFLASGRLDLGQFVGKCVALGLAGMFDASAGRFSKALRIWVPDCEKRSQRRDAEVGRDRIPHACVPTVRGLRQSCTGTKKGGRRTGSAETGPGRNGAKKSGLWRSSLPFLPFFLSLPLVGSWIAGLTADRRSVVRGKLISFTLGHR